MRIQEFFVSFPEQPTAVVPDCLTNIEKNEGEDLTCLCKGQGGNPPPNASWVKDGHVINGTGYLEKRLSIKNIRKKDAGLYTCRVVTVSCGLTDEETITLRVKCEYSTLCQWVGMRDWREKSAYRNTIDKRKRYQRDCVPAHMSLMCGPGYSYNRIF